MPELPEVETMVRGIRGAIVGRRIRSVACCPCDRKPILLEPAIEEMSRRANGATIESVWRRAKRVVIALSTADAFVIEPRMTGLMLLDEPPSVEHLRIEWRLRPAPARQRLGPRSSIDKVSDCTVSKFWFWDRRGLGTVRLLDPIQQEAVLGMGTLGKDALEMTVDDWVKLSQKTSSAIKVAMLDQKKVAGIGNLYASEILHMSKVPPELNANQLTPAQCKRIAEATISILQTAIKYEGSTLSDGTYRNALNKEGGYQNAHRVYAREGEKCPTCSRGIIQRIVQAQRSTFFCRVCQRLPRKRV